MFCDEFRIEFDDFDEVIKDEFFAVLGLLERLGPHLERPYVGSLTGSKVKNLKELRFDAANGVWRVAFAFDPLRQAVILAGADTSGISQMLFYKRLIKKAEARYENYLLSLESK